MQAHNNANALGHQKAPLRYTFFRLCIHKRNKEIKTLKLFPAEVLQKIEIMI